MLAQLYCVSPIALQKRATFDHEKISIEYGIHNQAHIRKQKLKRNATIKLAFPRLSTSGSSQFNQY